MRGIYTTTAVLGLLAGAVLGPVHADEPTGVDTTDPRPFLCDGCEPAEMASVATQVTASGEVFVFNASDREVRRYQVTTSFEPIEGTSPETGAKFRRETEATELEAPAGLATAYAELQASIEAFQASLADWALPDDFPIKTVAGAILDEGLFAGELSVVLQRGALGDVDERTHALWQAWYRAELPVLLFRAVTYSGRSVRVPFADGSSTLVTIDFAYDLMGENWLGPVLEHLPSAGRTASDGAPPSMKTSAGWDGFEVTGSEAVLDEWVRAAMGAGVKIPVTIEITDGATLACQGRYEAARCEIKS